MVDPLFVRQASILLYRLSGDGHPGKEAPLPDPTGATQKLQGLVASLGDAGRHRLLPVSHQGRKEGVALLWEGGTEPVVILPSHIFPGEPLTCSLRSDDAALLVFPDRMGGIERKIPAMTYFPPPADVTRLVDQAKMSQWGTILNRHAPPGFPWRRQFVGLLRSFLAHHGFPVTLEALHFFFLNQLNLVVANLDESHLFHKGIWHSCHYETSLFLRLLSELLEERLLTGLEGHEVNFSQLIRGRMNAIKRGKATMKDLVAEPIDAAMERLIEVPPWLYEKGARRNTLLWLRQLMVDTLGETDRTNKRVAVVGYGLDLDLIDFFLHLGFQVSGIEKEGAAQGLLSEFRAGPEDPDLLAAAIGFPELVLDEDAWPQFTPEEVREALEDPSRLTLWEASDPNLPLESFDLVLAPAIVDEAIPTAASLPQRGGLLVVESILYDKSPVAANPTGFCNAASHEFREEMSCVLPRGANALPMGYRGDQHILYALRRI